MMRVLFLTRWRMVFSGLLLSAFCAGAQERLSMGPSMQAVDGRERHAALGLFLKNQGLITPAYQLRYHNPGFELDTTVASNGLHCKAVFMEVLRSRVRPDQLAFLLNRYAGSQEPSASPESFFPEPFSEVYQPVEVDSLVFVLVQKMAPSQRRPFQNSQAAFLVVLQKAAGRLEVLEQTPLCRRRGAEDIREK